MRILIAHYRFQRRGGEDVVVANETLLLRNPGPDVENFSVDNDEIHGFPTKVAEAIGVRDNPAVFRVFDRALAAIGSHIRCPPPTKRHGRQTCAAFSTIARGAPVFVQATGEPMMKNTVSG